MILPRNVRGAHPILPLVLMGLALLGCSNDEIEESEPGVDQQATIATAPVDESVSGATSEPASSDRSAEELFPDVLDATATSQGDGQWTIEATLSSPYDSPDRYADAWRVLGPDGTVYGERILTHDHAGEQPFTRSQSGIVIPPEVTTVTIEGRDQVSGWGGATFALDLPK